MNAIPLSLYVHFPWCVKKCPYCDFNSHALQGDLPAAAYIDSLIADFDAAAKHEDRQSLTSIFLGGGTPSLFPPAEIKRLLDHVAKRFDISNIEITLEANPGTLDEGHFSGYLSAGINRLSVGAQSFSDQMLAELGRIHQSEDIARAVTSAREAGFRRINIDLMYGLPGQTIEGCLADLDQAISLRPEHISWYQLTIEPNTYFHRYPPARPAEHIVADFMEAGFEQLTRNGFRRYEISAFARPGEESHHNLNYWQFGDYLGIGAGAHGKVSGQDGIVRTTRTRVPADYFKRQSPILNRVCQDEILLEYLMNTLRLVDGFALEDFYNRTGLPASSLRPFVSAGLDRGLLERSDDSIRPSEKGLLFLNELLLLAA